MQKPTSSALNPSNLQTAAPFSLIDPSCLSLNRIRCIFDKASTFESGFQEAKDSNTISERRATIALLFFEPSTRTRFSFSVAGQKLGHNLILFDSSQGTSLIKGESHEDTILNIEAMQPDLLIIRCGAEVELQKMSENFRTPIINAGWGHFSHPSQALLDAYTLEKEFGGRPINILLVGDLSHSRVAYSNIEVLRKLGHNIAIHSPLQFIPQGLASNIQVFSDLDKGLLWAQSAMFFRVQHERHPVDLDVEGSNSNGQALTPLQVEKPEFNQNLYHVNHGLTLERLKLLPADFKILHPGPVQFGVEVCKELASDPRSLILSQVRNGVAIRAAIIELLLHRSFQGLE